MDTQKAKTESLSMPEVETLLTTTRAELLDTAKRDGKYTGLKNTPSLMDKSCIAHLAPLKGYAEERRAMALTLLQPELHNAAIVRIEEQCKQESAQIRERIQELTHLNAVDAREMRHTQGTVEAKTSLLGWVLVVLIGLSDLAFNAGAFEALGDSLLFAIGIAFGVAIATFAFAKGIAYYLRGAFTKDRKSIVITACLAFFALAGFWVLSEFRLRQMAAQGTGQSGSALSYFFLNLFFFVAAIVVALRYFPDEQKQKEYSEQDQRLTLIREREKEIATLKEKLSKQRDLAEESCRTHRALLSYAAHVMHRFAAVYKESVAIWKSTNLLSRPDQSMPISFSAPVESLDPVPFVLLPTTTTP